MQAEFFWLRDRLIRVLLVVDECVRREVEEGSSCDEVVFPTAISVQLPVLVSDCPRQLIGHGRE